MVPMLPEMTHPMDDDAAMWLRAMYKVEDLDPKVVSAYNQLRIAADRISAPAAGHAFLYSVIAMSGVPIIAPKTTFLDYIKAGAVRVDQPLMIKIGKEWQDATYVGFSDGKVIYDQAGVERTADPKTVKFAEGELVGA